MAPYERLLGDAMRGDGSLFTREDAVEAAWRVVDPVLGNSRRRSPSTSPAPGDRPEADALVDGDGGWHNPEPSRRDLRMTTRSPRRSSSCSTSTTRCSTTTGSSADLTRASRASSSGAERRERYWAIFEKLRDELGYADYLGALQRYRLERPATTRTSLLRVVLPAGLPVRRTACIPARSMCSARFAPRGRRSSCPTATSSSSRARSSAPGLWEAVEGHVLIYIHKEQELDDVEQRYPARALRPGRRQAAHPDGGEEGLGRPA